MTCILATLLIRKTLSVIMFDTNSVEARKKKHHSNIKFIEWSWCLRDLYNFNCLECEIAKIHCYSIYFLWFCCWLFTRNTRVKSHCVLVGRFFDESSGNCTKSTAHNIAFSDLKQHSKANHQLSSPYFLNIRTFPLPFHIRCDAARCLNFVAILPVA